MNSKIFLVICIMSALMCVAVECCAEIESTIEQEMLSKLTQEQILDLVEKELEAQKTDNIGFIATCIGFSAIPIAVVLFILHECYFCRNLQVDASDDIELQEAV
jgi:hypothetical protein